jgi:hypothetical protein
MALGADRCNDHTRCSINTYVSDSAKRRGCKRCWQADGLHTCNKQPDVLTLCTLSHLGTLRDVLILCDFLRTFRGCSSLCLMAGTAGRLEVQRDLY